MTQAASDKLLDAAERDVGGRPPFEPSDEQRRTVRTMTAYGIAQDEIAAVMQIAPKTLRLHFRHELDTAGAEANARVAANLFRMATGDGRAAATTAIFWMKARAGWSEKSQLELTGKDGGPVEVVSARERLTERVARLARATEPAAAEDDATE